MDFWPEPMLTTMVLRVEKHAHDGNFTLAEYFIPFGHTRPWGPPKFAMRTKKASSLGGFRHGAQIELTFWSFCFDGPKGRRYVCRLDRVPRHHPSS